MEMLAIFAIMIAAMYFLMIRPQQKRAKEHQTMLNDLSEGSRVMLTSGIFGTIRHLGEKQAVIELAPGSEITILRQAIMRPVNEDEDEFEYTDEDDIADPDVVGNSSEELADQAPTQPGNERGSTDV